MPGPPIDITLHPPPTPQVFALLAMPAPPAGQAFSVSNLIEWGAMRKLEVSAGSYAEAGGERREPMMGQDLCGSWQQGATLSPYLNMQPSAPDRPNPDRILPARLVGHSSLPSSPLSPPCSSQPISAISTTASKEFSLRKALAKMQAEWGDKFFHCTPYKDTGTAVVGQTDDIQVWRCGTVGKYGVQTGEMPPLTQQGAYPPGPALSVCVLQDQTPTALNPIPPPPLPDGADRPSQDVACRECYKP